MMHKLKLYTKRLGYIVLTSLLLISCNITKQANLTDSETKNNNDITPSATPVLEEVQNPEELDTSMEEHPHNMYFDFLENGIELDVSGINYSNFINQMPIVKLDSIRFEFGFDGVIKRTNTITNSYEEIHIKDILSKSSILENTNEPQDWFFITATANKDYIYAQYDYWSTERYSLLICIDKTGEYAEICASNPYLDNETLNSFAVTNNYIFSTFHTFDNDNTITSSIIVKDLDGSNPKILKSFPSNYEVSSIIPQENQLFFFVNDIENQKNSVYVINTKDLSLNPVIENCITQDFLYIYKDYAIVGCTDSQLIYYKFYSSTPNYLLMGKSDGLHFGNILINDYGCYVPVFSWENTTPTKILPLNLEDKTTGEYILFSYDYKRIVGIDNEAVYAEAGDSYISYDIDTKEELSY